MKLKLLLFVALSVLSTTLYSQIKIGDNPQNLDPASVLELESTNRVFVITRITTVEMNAINPLQGAMIYNTDEQCLYYFDGTEWINLCDALRLTFTADPIFNDYSTIVITESEDNVNFEVREIRGQNIVDFTITSVDIQNNAITSSKLAPDSVGNEELQDNTVSDAEIDYAQVTLNDFTNDAGFITSASIVSADVGNTIIAGSDNGAFYDVTPVQNALDALDVAVTTISLIDNGDGTYNFSDSVGNIQLITTNGLTVTNTVAGNLIATVTLADGTTLNINETITSLTDNGDGLITYTKEDGSQETVAKADITDLGDGTYTFTNNDGSDVTLNTNGLTVTNTVPGNLIATLTLADGSSNAVNETITSLIDNGDGFITYTKEDGTQETVAKADITDLGDGTYTFTNNDGSDVTLNTNGLTVTNTVAGNLIATLTLADGSSTAVNETITSLIDNGDGFITYTTEEGLSETVAKADITDNLDGTYTFTNNDGTDITLNTNGLTVTNTVAGNLIATLTLADGSSTAVNETITSLIDNGDGFVTFTKEDGTQDTVAKADITDNLDGTYTFTNNDGTDVTINTNAISNPYDNTISGLAASNVQEAIDLVSTAVAGGSDDQVISTDGTPGNIDLEDGGGPITINVEDGDFDDTNELNTGIAMNAGALEITDAAGPLSENLISVDLNNDIIFGSDGRLYINVDAAASGETTTNLVDNGDGSFTFTNEIGTPQLVFKADITDNGDGTYTFTNNDGSDETIDTRAGSNPYDNTVVGVLTASNVQAALDELAGGADSQDLTGASLDALNILQIDIQNGASTSVDLSALDNPGTDDQALSLAAGNILTLEDGGTVDLTPFLDNTDDQVITTFSLNNTTNVLTLTLEDGGTQTVDFSTVLAAAGTDDQALSLAAGNILTLEDGGTVDLTPFLDNTDDQVITTFSLNNTTNVLTLTLEDGGTQTVDFSTVLAAAGTDDQALSLAAGNILTLEDGGTVDLTPFLDNTDDQVITTFSLNNTTNVLTLTLEDGGTQTVDFSTVLAAAGTDDQALSLAAGNILTLEDGGTVDLTPFLDNTDDQVITTFSLNNTTNVLTLTLEDGGTQTVDFSTVLAAAGTDDQALSLAAGNILTLEDGGTVDLTPFLDNTDDQVITTFSLNNTTNVLTLTLEDGGTQTVDFSTVLAAAGTDDQALSLAAGNILTLEDGGTVDLTPFLDNTDDQVITTFSLNNTTNVLTLTLEDGGTQTVDFSTVLAAAGTDDQALSLAAGNILTLEDGGTVDLTPFLDNTDDQVITTFSLNNTTNVLTLTLEDGGTQTVDFSTVLAAAGTDDQNATEVLLSPSLDVDGDTTNETTVQEAIADLAATNPGANLSNQNLTQTNFNRTYNIGAGYLNFSGAGNLGVDVIGAPVEKFEVNGKIRASSGFLTNNGSGGSPSYSFNTDTGTGMFRPLANQLGFSTGGFQALRIDANQNMGIKEFSPTSTLHVSGSLATAVLEGSGVINLDDTHHTVLFTANGSIVLPSAASSPGRIYLIKNPSFTVGSTSYLDGSGTAQTTIPSGGSIWLQSIGGNWHQIN